MGLRVVAVILMGLFGYVCVKADITIGDWEFWALLAIMLCYGIVRYLDGCESA